MSWASKTKIDLNSEVEKRYRELFADLRADDDELAQISAFFKSANPPPSAVLWCRSTAFRIGAEFLGAGREDAVSVLRCINSVVHAVEVTLLAPRHPSGGGSFDGDAVEELYRTVVSDLSVDAEEREELVKFFCANPVPASKLAWTRAAAFRIASEFATGEKGQNVALLRCVNTIVDVLEKSSMVPKPLKLEEAAPENTISKMSMSVTLEEAIQRLWDLDANRLVPGKDYAINVQRFTKVYNKEDEADDPLFSRVSGSALQGRTFKTFIALLDNYKAEVGAAEVITSHERKEIWDFIAAIMATGPMQYCFHYCAAHNDQVKLSDPKGFTKLLYEIWFELYNRSRAKDSSGFEHVFVGEIKNGAVTGFHNWIQFYLTEKKGHLNYKGYIKPRARGRQALTNFDDSVLSVKFDWKGVEKAVGTILVGTSPEFEMALYTMCFLAGGEDTRFALHTGTDEFLLNVKCYTMARNKIGTSFPECLEHY
mmetsp:Transcript_24784/g.49308  ORF Transcript_24784/g.49308 Transcript_24784/m.49308 type:complete len:482 (-) Transcript_24784:233-1678(-)|eukprot:CAMPEP_0194312228 /NCGR_PEP_ID=MMETSP0171-20130528/9148_1 /TAXON_ID=218684 /ORGANISM="Corethron pennatum, Strain L29A3" /LENGTH=481 /DNA_ID=CAMNT_0039066655 /DNA_START=105 /DNA_END=1550 /DNA_ORIENTATION=-